jgi:hypothetical protein
MAEQTRTRSVAGLIALPLCLAIGAVVGCSSNSDAPSNADAAASDDSAGISCTGDPRGEVFTMNVPKPGDMHALSFVITDANFVPPAKGNNSWTMKILDASGQAVKDAVLSFPKTMHLSDPWMPDHSHGALPAKATDNMDGTYTITPLDFFMGGIWSTFISVANASGVAIDTITLTYCIPI